MAEHLYTIAITVVLSLAFFSYTLEKEYEKIVNKSVKAMQKQYLIDRYKGKCFSFVYIGKYLLKDISVENEDVVFHLYSRGNDYEMTIEYNQLQSLIDSGKAKVLDMRKERIDTSLFPSQFIKKVRKVRN